MKVKKTRLRENVSFCGKSSPLFFTGAAKAPAILVRVTP